MEITKNNLIDIVCKWMDYHNNDESYITETSSGMKFINGGYQTDLRYFVNTVLSMNIPYWDAIDEAKKDNKNPDSIDDWFYEMLNNGDMDSKNIEKLIEKYHQKFG